MITPMAFHSATPLILTSRNNRSIPPPNINRCGRSPVRMVTLTRQTDKGSVKRVVVTGAGVVSCFGCDVDVFYDSLLRGKSGMRKVESFDVEGWSTDFAAWISPEQVDASNYVAPKLLRRLDPFLVYALIAGKKSLEQAGLSLSTQAFDALDKTRCGVLCGSGMGGLGIYTEGVQKLISRGHTKMSPFFIPYAITNMVRGFVLSMKKELMSELLLVKGS